MARINNKNGRDTKKITNDFFINWDVLKFIYLFLLLFEALSISHRTSHHDNKYTIKEKKP
jgi:hypothetical protein